jgi:hypothetical protein
MEQQNMPKDFPLAQAMAYAKSPAGQQLMQMLRQKNDPNLNRAAQLAASGKAADARQALSGLLSDPDIQALLKQLGG